MRSRGTTSQNEITARLAEGENRSPKRREARGENGGRSNDNACRIGTNIVARLGGVCWRPGLGGATSYDAESAIASAAVRLRVYAPLGWRALFRPSCGWGPPPGSLGVLASGVGATGVRWALAVPRAAAVGEGGTSAFHAVVRLRSFGVCQLEESERPTKGLEKP